MDDRCCETCRFDLGGGYNNCKINLESECAAGGFEAWEAASPRACGFAKGQTADGRIEDSSAAPEPREDTK